MTQHGFSADQRYRVSETDYQEGSYSPEKNDGVSYSSTGIVDIGNTKLRMYKDKHGIPVAYDAETDRKRKQNKSDAISVLSHELLSPLTLIKGYTATLLQLGEVITEEQRRQYFKALNPLLTS